MYCICQLLKKVENLHVLLITHLNYVCACLEKPVLPYNLFILVLTRFAGTSYLYFPNRLWCLLKLKNIIVKFYIDVLRVMLIKQFVCVLVLIFFLVNYVSLKCCIVFVDWRIFLSLFIVGSNNVLTFRRHTPTLAQIHFHLIDIFSCWIKHC